MASKTSCRLCGFTCNEFKSLCDEKDEPSEVYQIAVKYFNSSLLDGEIIPALRVICLECWQHISDFHSFQQWILIAQSKQEDLKFFIYEESSSEQLSVSDSTDLNIDTTTTKSIKLKKSIVYDKKNDVCFSEISNECNTKINIVDQDVAKNPSTNRDENSYKCELCGASFAHYGNLRRHVRKKHRVQPLLKWKCKDCNKFFRYRSHLQRHKNKHSNCKFGDNSESNVKQKVNNDENCMTDSEPEDKQNYKRKIDYSNGNNAVNRISSKINSEQQQQQQKQGLKETSDNNNTLLPAEDISNNGNIIELDLPLASSPFENNPNMQIHMPVLDIIDIKDEISTDAESNEDTEQVINNCNFNELNSDVEGEEEDDDFLARSKDGLECPSCNLHVRNYLELKEHFNFKHPEERCYINCCGMILYDRQSIAEHLKFHENPNAFECSDCGKCFKNRKGLSSHNLQVHSDNRSTYHLHLCHCKTSQKRRAKKLADGKQSEYDTIQCCQRKKKILEDDSLIAKWKKELSCEICKAKFSYYSLLRTHFYHKHPGEKCNIFCCQRKMSRISDALQHIRFHLDPHAYRCKICNVDFSGKNTLSKHMRNAHFDEIPKHRWACDECDKTFEIRQILTRHKNVHHSKKV